MRLLTGFVLAGHGLGAIVLLLIGVTLWPPRTGVDLGGSVRLVYAVERNRSVAGSDADDERAPIDWSSLTNALRNRIDPSGFRDVVVRPCGDAQFEIVVAMDAAEIQDLKQRIAATGLLEFRIVANARDHQHIISLAEEQAQDPVLEQRLNRLVVNSDGEKLGRWVQVVKQKITAAEVADQVLRNSATGEMVDFRELAPVRDDGQLLDNYLAKNGLEDVDILVSIDDDCDVTGDYLGAVAAAVDEYLNPCINFRLRGEGVVRFQLLTSENRPDMESMPPFYRHLGIILDDQLLSFPRLISTISDSGRITGSFTQSEVDFLVAILRAGRLPVPVQEMPVSESYNEASPRARRIATLTLGLAMGVLVIIWLTMVLRYGLVGLGGSLASLLQVLAMLAVVELARLPVALPIIFGGTALALFNGVGLLLVCAAVPRHRLGASKPGPVWRKLTIRMFAFAVVLAILFVVGGAMHIVGIFPLRSVGLPVATGSLVAFLTLGSCVLVPIVLLANASVVPEKCEAVQG